MLSLIHLNSYENICNGTAWGLTHFQNLFHNKLEKYIGKLTDKIKPKKIMVCMLYYPDLNQTGGWADMTLWASAVSKISNVETLKWYDVLDGTDTHDYVERAEPSSKGSIKMANHLFKKLLL